VKVISLSSYIENVRMRINPADFKTVEQLID